MLVRFDDLIPKIKEVAAWSAAAQGDSKSQASSCPKSPGPEGDSLGNVRRGDRRWTFPNEPCGHALLLRAMTQSVEFTADTLLAAPGGV